MKAYHNLYNCFIAPGDTVFQWTKIQNWKLITTSLLVFLTADQLYFNELRYKIESLSQLKGGGEYALGDCISMN